MFSPASKTAQTHPSIQQRTAGNAFFTKAGEDRFFGAKENNSFFKPPVQAKLTVSSPDDPQEKEADAVAEKVMRMPEPVIAEPVLPTPVTAGKVAEKKDEKLQLKEEEELQSKQEQPVSCKIQCKAEPEEKIQARLDNPVFRVNKKGSHVKVQTCCEACSDRINKKDISLYRSDILRQSGRGPPIDSIPFEQTLASSKGGGSALPGDTQQFMESRFNADFSGVRIHTDSTAQQLSRSVHAQAFAHGNDIYFNSGKFSPHSTEGGVLLAHELTHTIQQGASKSIQPSRYTAQAKKDNTQRRTYTNLPAKSAIDKNDAVEGQRGGASVKK